MNRSDRRRLKRSGLAKKMAASAKGRRLLSETPKDEELADEGHTPAAVASSTGVKVETVTGVLDLREEEAS